MTAKPPVHDKPRPLTREGASRSMKRIVCQFPSGPAATNAKDYFETIFEQMKLAEISEQVFDAACLRLAGTMLPYKPPMASEYLEAARHIKAESLRRKENCSSCQGKGWIYVKDLRDPSGEKLAVAHCQTCAPVVP